MAWTPPRTWVAGEQPTAAIFNTHIRDNFLALDTGPYSYAHLNADVAAGTSGVWTDITSWSVDNSDTVTYSGGTWTLPPAGRYLVFASISYTANATGSRGIRPVINGVVGQNILVPTVTTATYQATVQIYNEVVLGAASTIKFQAHQNSGGALNLRGDTAGLYSRVGVRRVGN
ncbi:hypothetical protein [Kribbella sp. DT2]|uniref:hypothetical protein n=1 Tax=Kribbella sp. DT2 TaxID=3393427 RepID=UPI003CEA083A